MPRAPRIEFPNAMYHVMSRGNRRENIVTDDDDRWMLIRTLGEMAARAGILVHAYAVMDNHYHFVLETPKGNLVDGMRWFQTAYTQRFNAKNRMWGHLFGGRYKSIVIQDKEGPYFRQLIDYVHLNPVRAGLIEQGKGFDSYEWTSLREYRKPPSKRFQWMETADSFNELQIKDTTTGRRRYIERLESLVDWTSPDDAGRVLWEGQSLQSTLERGWYFGTQGFREELLKRFGKEEIARERKKRLLTERGSFKNDHDESLAARIVEHGLKVLEISAQDLGQLKKNDWRKALIAQALCEHTSVKQQWIVDHLKMGTKPYVSRLASDMKKQIAEEKRLQRLQKHIVAILA